MSPQRHELSPRGRGPFVAVNCAAVAETLLEAERFGIEDHTVTSVRGRRGKFEHADGGPASRSSKPPIASTSSLSLDFYRDVLEFEPADVVPSRGLATLDVGGQFLRLREIGAERPRPDGIGVTIYMDDPAIYADRLRTRGVAVESEFTGLDGQLSSFSVRDADGYALRFFCAVREPGTPEQRSPPRAPADVAHGRVVDHATDAE